MVDTDNSPFDNELKGFFDVDNFDGGFFQATNDAPMAAVQIPDEPWRASSLPLDPLFQTEKTSLVLGPATPVELLGKGLLEFFDCDVEAQVSKVRPGKAAVKADVFVEAARCSVKARVYERPQGGLLLELQRRSGDCCAFLALFRRALAFFECRFNAEPAPSCAALARQPLPRPPAPPQSLSLDVAQSPLLDLAQAPDEALRAEAAAALSEIAEESLEQLASGRPAEVLEELLQESLAVAQPLAKLLQRMARQPRTLRALRGTGLLEAARRRVQDPQTPPLLRRALAEALSIAAR